jgi:ABC-type multidrug transport system permease subunit
MRASLFGIASVAYKEFLHIIRDVRIMVLVVALPPLMTLIFGHAFEVNALTGAPVAFEDRDQSDESQKFFQFLSTKETFAWKPRPAHSPAQPDLLRERVQGALLIPANWGKGLKGGTPVPVQLSVDGSDTTTGAQISGAVQAALGEFQLQSRQEMIDQLPAEVFDLAQQLPLEVRKQFVSAMEPWPLKTEVLFNPKQRFIDYVIPGIIGLILQLLTVTLMACTIARERESGTLYQLMVTSLKRTEIVIGKVLPYLALSMFLIATTVAVALFHFDVKFQQPLVLALICLLFLCCSLGLGLLISTVCTTQTQSIQLAVFYLLPVFPLSGAFAPLEQLPDPIQVISQSFPLTHFCHAFRLINLHNADFSLITGDLTFLFLGAVATCTGAGFLLKRIEE